MQPELGKYGSVNQPCLALLTVGGVTEERWVRIGQWLRVAPGGFLCSAFQDPTAGTNPGSSSCKMYWQCYENNVVDLGTF